VHELVNLSTGVKNRPPASFKKIVWLQCPALFELTPIPIQMGMHLQELPMHRLDMCRPPQVRESKAVQNDSKRASGRPLGRVPSFLQGHPWEPWSRRPESSLVGRFPPPLGGTPHTCCQRTGTGEGIIHPEPPWLVMPLLLLLGTRKSDPNHNRRKSLLATIDSQAFCTAQVSTSSPSTHPSQRTPHQEQVPLGTASGHPGHPSTWRLPAWLHFFSALMCFGFHLLFLEGKPMGSLDGYSNVCTFRPVALRGGLTLAVKTHLFLFLLKGHGDP
jgi:hypothetical protein